MHRCILFLGLLLLQITSFSQIKLLNNSASFEEPRNGFVKLQLLKNGHTAYVYLNDDALLIKLFNTEYKEIASKEHKFPNGSLKRGEFEKIFEHGGKLIVIVNEFKKDHLYKYKAVLNTENGEMISYESLNDIANKTISADLNETHKDKKIGAVYIINDPNSEYYSLITFLYNENNQEGYFACVFDKQNQVVKKFNYFYTKSANIKYSFLAGMTMNADKAIYILNNNELEKKDKFKDAEFELIIMNKENAQGTSKLIDVLEGEQPTDAIMKFNPITNLLHIVTQVDLKSPVVNNNFFLMKTEYSKKYSISHRTYNDLTNQFQLLPPIDLTDIDQLHRKVTEDHTSYRGVLQDFYIHQDGGYTYVMEGLKTTTKTHISTSQNTGIMHERTSTIYNLGSVVSVRYSLDNQKQHASLAFKEQLINNALIGGGAGVTTSPAYHYNVEIGAQQLKGGNQYKSFGFITGNKNNYTLFNDLEENIKRIAEKKDPKVVKSINDCNGYYFQSTTNSITPTPQLLTPINSNKDWQPYMFTVSDFDQLTGKYVTLKYSEDKGKKLNLAWFQID